MIPKPGDAGDLALSGLPEIRQDPADVVCRSAVSAATCSLGLLIRPV